MAKSLRSIAQNELSVSALVSGKTKLENPDIVGETLTLIAFDMATATDESGEEKIYPVFLVKEYPDSYLPGGTLLNKMAQAWIAEYDGDVSAASDALAEEGGVQIVVNSPKKGKRYYSVDIL